MKKKDILIIASIILGISLIHSCAQIGQISGGPKDSIPPEWVGSKPINYSVNFEGRSVKLYFDEYFKFEKLQDRFVISPPVEEEPDVKSVGKKAVVKFKSPLQPNTTYSLQFGDAIADYTEGNNYPNLTFVFSTGEVVDSLAIGGNLYDAKTLEPVEGSFVMVYKELQDSTPYLRKPDYLALTDTAGRFLIPNIGSAKYYLFALKDMNKNQLFDLPTESISFLDSIVTPGAESIVTTDTLFTEENEVDTIKTKVETLLYPNNIKLFSFEEEHRVPYISEKTRTLREKIDLVFPRLLDTNLVVQFVDSALLEHKNWYTKEFSANNDSVSLWITNQLISKTDTLQLGINYTSWDSIEQPYRRTDTVRIIYKKIKTPAKDNFVKYFTNIKDKVLEYGEDIFFLPEILIKEADPNLLKIYELRDTTVQDKRIQELTRFQRPTLDSLVFWFSRPLPQTPVFKMDSTNKKWYDLELDTTRKKAMLKVTDSSFVAKDTMQVEALFSNLYYNDAIIRQRKKMDILYSQQKVIKAERKGNRCSFWFDKIQSKKFSIAAVNSADPNWKTRQSESVRTDSMRVDLWVNPATARLNNILIEIQAEDQTPTGKDTLVTMRVGFMQKEQKLLAYQRTDSSTLKLDFDLPLIKAPEMNPQNFRSFKVWFDGEFNADSTSFTARLKDKNNIEQDSLTVMLSYSYLDSLAVEKINQKQLLFIKGQEKIEVGKPAESPQAKPEEKQQEAQTNKNEGFETKSWNAIPFIFEQDSAHMRKYWIKAKFKPEVSYRLIADSKLFSSYWETYSDTISLSFEMKDKSEYGTLNLYLRNVPADAFLEILDKKGEKVIRQVGYIQKGLTSVGLLQNGEYQVRIFCDPNRNKRWDTGNFLQKILPEKVFRYIKVIPISEGITVEETWDLEDEKVSFGPTKESLKAAEEKKKSKKKKGGGNTSLF